MSNQHPDHAFYAAVLRFVASKTTRDDPRIDAMMEALSDAAYHIEQTGLFCVSPDRLELTARAFAGVAAFLQRQILPAAIGEGNGVGEKQIRWAVDSAMATVNTLLKEAAASATDMVEITVPPCEQQVLH